MGKYYAVKVGRIPGVYTSWSDCLEQVKAFSGAAYKSFPTKEQAERFIDISGDDFIPDHVINTDGGCTGNGSTNSKGGIGVTIHGPKHNYEVAYPLPLSFVGMKIVPTNQIAELFAIICALEYIIDYEVQGCKFVLRTDSQYSIQCLTSWCQGWIANGWKTQKGDVQNKEIIQHALSLLDQVKVNNSIKFEHVYGHNGDPGNERVDQLATEGIQMYVSFEGK